MMKLSEKAKIILAVIAVAVVAVGAVSFAALSINANNVQGNLSSNGDVSASAESDDFSIIVDPYDIVGNEYTGRKWSTDISNPTVIGMYTGEDIISNFVPADTFNYQSADISVFEIDSDGNQIGESTQGTDMDDIAVQRAGIYAAEVNVQYDDNGETKEVKRTFYAQVKQAEKTVLKVEINLPQDSLTYSGKLIEGFELRVTNSSESIDSLVEWSVSFADYYTGETSSDGIVINSDGLFDVTYAGRYVVTLKLNDTAKEIYKFENNLDTAKLEFEVKQAVVAGSVKYGSDYSNDLTVEQLLSEIVFTPNTATGNDQTGKYTIEYALFADSGYNTPLTNLSVGTKIYVKATIAPYSQGDSVYRNYRLPVQGEAGFSEFTQFSFNLTAPALARPSVSINYYDAEHASQIGFPRLQDMEVSTNSTRTVIYATYLNFGYKVSQWFYGSHDLWTDTSKDGHSNGENWNVTVSKDGGEPETIDPNTYEMKNVGKYVVTITPKDGFRFAEQNEYVITLEISPFTLDTGYIRWESKTKHVYDGNPVNFGRDDYILDLPSLLSEDNDKIILEIEHISIQLIDGKFVSTVINEAPVNAGTYNYRIKENGIKGDVADNYKLPPYEINNSTSPFKIYKKELPDYSGKPIVKGIFNGKEQVLDIAQTFVDMGLAVINVSAGGSEEYVPYIIKLDQLNFSTHITHSYPSDWGVSESKTVAASFEIGRNFCFTGAGSYSVTFVLPTDSDFGVNHCWYGGDDEPGSTGDNYVWENFILIERAEIDPSLPGLTMSVNDTVIDLKEYVAQRFANIKTDNPYALTFGSADNGEKTEQFDFILNNGEKKYEVGEYYLLIDLDESIYPDCIFSKSSADDGKYKIENDGKRVRIEYSVSSNTVSVSYKVTDYVFGDNFADGFGIDDVFTFERHTVEGATVAFDDPIFEFYTDAQRAQEATLHNGLLPRNAGKYYFKITINYTVDGESFVWSRSGELNVTKRPIDGFVWSLDGSETSELSVNFPYNGNAHTVSVIASVPSGLPAVNVALSGNSATDVDEYTFRITGLTGDEADNYSYDGLTNTSFTVNISHAQISVTANNVASIKYGQEFIFDESAYEVTGDAKDLFVSQNLNVNLSLAVYFVGSDSLTLVTEYNLLGCGQYLVIPVYAGNAVPDTLTVDNKYVLTVGNYELTMTASGFSVSAEQLIVTLYGGSSSVYGDPVNLYVPYDGSKGIYATNLNLSEEEFKKAVNLTATALRGGASATDDKADAGTYRLRAALTDYGKTNYSIIVKYVGENGNTSVANYEITRRKITIETIDIVGHIYGNGYNAANNVFNVTSGSILDSDKNVINIYCSVFVYNGQFNNKTSELSSLSVGGYYHIAAANGIVGERLQREDGTYYTVAAVGNYEVTSIASMYEIVPREITLTFTDGSSVYGDNIDLWKRQNNVSASDIKYYSTYDYCQANGLRFDGANLDTLTDNLKNVIELSLVNGDKTVLVGAGTCNAGTYRFKATIKNENYVIANGTNGGAEFVGGQFVVNPKSITIQTTTTKSSVEYGNGLNGVVLDFTVSGLVNGDVKGDLNIVLGVYDGENRIENVAEYGVGNYVIGIDASGINSNYVIAENGIATASFGITKRTITLTFTSDGGASVYGETVTSDMLYAATVGSLANLVNGHTYQNVVALNAVHNGVDVTTANASVGEYLITAALNSDYSDNYALNISGQGKYVITPRKVVLKPDAVNHNYGTNYDATAPKYTVEGSFVSSADEKVMQIVAVITNGAGQTVTNSIASQPVGEYTIKLSVTNPNSNYDVDVTTYCATFTILVCKAMVKFNLSTSPSNVYGEPIDLEELRKNIRSNDLFTIDGLLDGDESNVEIKIVKKDDESVSATDKYAPVGDYVLVVTLGDNYNVEYVGWDYDLTKKIYSVTERSVKIGANDVLLVYGNNFDTNKLSYKVADGSLYQPLENDDLKVTLAVFDGENVVSNIATQNVGNYAIKIDKSSANENYDIEVVDGKFAITQATVKLTANAVSVTYGDELTLSGEWYTASSANTTQATITSYLAANTVTYETNYVKGATNANATGITITPKCESSDNVKIEVVGAAVTVTKRIITISFTQNGGTSVYGANVDLYDGSVGALAANNLVGLDRYDGVVTLKATLDGQSMADRNYGIGAYVVTATIANNNYIFADSATTASAKGKYVITPAAISWTGSVDANKTYTYSGNAYSVDDVSAKLSFNVANPDVNTVTIEYLVYEAGHSCDATLPWNDATTIVPSYVNAGTYTVYVRFIANNHETAYFATQLTLTVNKGILTITAKPHSVTYGDELTLSENWYTATSDTITETTINSYLANNAVSYTTNYVKATTQAKENGIIITPSCNGDDNVQINAVDGIVTVDKRSITITYNNDKSSVYGNDIVDKTELYTLIGALVNENDISVTVLLNGEEASSTSAAGKYEVNVSANKNYDVTYSNAINDKGEYNINKRPVTVSLENYTVVYTEDVDDSGNVDYHGGRYGKTQNVTAQFNNNVDTFVLGTHYNVTYTLDNATAVPNKVGVYKVTIELFDDNYELSGETEFTYEITRKQIVASTFMWETPTLMVNNENHGKFDNGVKSYVSDILQISENGFTVTIDNSETKTVTQGTNDNTYYFDENGQLRIRIKVENTQVTLIYSVSFGLNAEAQHNYELSGSEVKDGLIKRDFSVSSKTVIAVLKQPNWQYSDSPILPSTVTQIGDLFYEPSNPESVVIRYAPVINAAEAKKFVGDGDGYDFNEIKHLFEDGTLSESFNSFNVGYYVICVTYSGLVEDESGNTEYIAIRRFDVFEVTKKELPVPEFENVTFKGQQQTLTVIYNNDVNGVALNQIVGASYNGKMIYSGDEIRETNAGKYTILFTIKEELSDKYTWELGGFDADISVVWTIEIDDADNDNDNRYFTVDNMNFTYGDTIALNTPDILKEGYTGTFTWEFASKRSDVDDPSVLHNWATSIPNYAGEFWVKVTLSDGNKNYTDKVYYAVLVIDKATLTLTPNGTITYGDSFGDKVSKYKYALKGFVNNESESVISGTVTYMLVGGNETILNASSEGYDLTVATVDGFVKGLSAYNYNIIVENGKLVVNKREVTVTISDVLNRQYGWTIDLNKVTATSDDEFAQSEVVEYVIKPEYLNTTAKVDSPIGDYVISSTYDNGNFDITYVNGKYQIVARKVTVTLTNGGGVYGKTITAVTYTATIADENGAETNLDASEGFVISVLYNGVSDVPANAGNYAVTVTANGNNDYALANDPTLTFVIEKFEVNVNKISVQTKVYDGTARKPEILIEADADFTADIFQVTSDHSGFITAKDYPVELKLNDFNNYKWSDSDTAYTTVIFTIDLAGIYAKPFGEMTYGAAFDKHTVQWEFVYADGRAVPEEEIINIDYDALGFTFDKEINLDRPTVETYGITCNVDATGRVIGLTNGNFNITLQKNDGQVVYGEYVVNPKEITIIAGDSQSIYSQDPMTKLSYTFTLDHTIDGNSLADGEVLTDVIKQYTPVVNANSNSNADKYIVTATAQADNYKVTVKSGVHTIKPITVKVVLEATNGVYNTTDVTYGVKELIATNLDGAYSFGAVLNGKLTFDISGTLNSGASYVYNGSLPTDAGEYVVTVTAINGNDNFVLDENDWVQTASFAIAKKTIDENSIADVSKEYNGKDQSHGLVNGEGYTASTALYKTVGEHTVTLTLTDRYNYEWSNHKRDLSISRVFSITKATLTLKPYGEITYGESFDANVRLYGFTLGNLKGDDIGKRNDEIVNGSVKYLLANGIDGTKLSVKNGGYVMIADVSGLSSDNYYIDAIDGVLIVNRREISIQPNSSESVYGEQVVVSQTFKVVNGELANGDDQSVIEYLASTVATDTSDAGAYAVTAVASNGNYDITVLNGTHTIKRAKVGVRIRPINGAYGSDNGTLVEFMSTVVINSDNTTKPISHLQFVISYDGVANDGTDYIGREAPTKAGIYEATVIEVLSNNYELDASYGISRTAVVIDKCQIDAKLITAVSAEYTGKAIIPAIEDTRYNVNGKVIYIAESDGEYVNVGKYNITLRLVDVDNYAWVDNLNRNAIIEFEIVKADNRLVDVNNPNAPAESIKVEISDWTFGGTANKPQAAVANGKIVFEYATSENGAYTTEVPVDAGEYWVRATVAASDNYNAFVSKPTKFVINKKVVSLPVATNFDGNSVYTGSMLSLVIDGFDDQVMSLTLDEGMYRADKDGKLNLLALNANKYQATFKLRSDKNYVWADESQLTNGAVIVDWTVERQVIKILPDAANKILVNGEDIVFIPEGFNSGIMTIEDNVRAHEGLFSAVVTLKDTNNYVWEGTDSASITVEFELTGTNTVFIAAICVIVGLCVGLAVMAVILTFVNRNKKRKEAEAIDARSRADGWEGD